MPFSLMGGLSAAGAGVAQYAGEAGLAAQRAQLQQQAIQLSESLGHGYRMSEQAQQQEAQKGIVGMQEAGAQQRAELQAQTALATEHERSQAVLGAAGISAQASTQNVQATIAANQPLVFEQAHRAHIEAGLQADQLQMADQSTGLSLEIAAEMSKPPEQQDQAKLSQLQNQRAQLNLTPDLNAKIMESQVTMMRSVQQELNGIDANIARMTAELANIDMSGDQSAHATQAAALAQMQKSRDDVMARLHLLNGAAMVTMQQFRGQQGQPQPAPSTQGTPQVDLSKFLQRPGTSAAPAAPAASPPAAPSGQGLINNPVIPPM